MPNPSRKQSDFTLEKASEFVRIGLALEICAKPRPRPVHFSLKTGNLTQLVPTIYPIPV
jgi:hypothetical protein